MMRERARRISNGLLAVQTVVGKSHAIVVGLGGRTLVPHNTDEERTVTYHTKVWRVTHCPSPWLRSARGVRTLPRTGSNASGALPSGMPKALVIFFLEVPNTLSKAVSESLWATLIGGCFSALELTKVSNDI